MNVVITLLLLIVILLLFYCGYRIITNKPIIPDFKKKNKPTSSPQGTLSAQPPDTNALGYCVFEGEDLYSGDVYTFDGKKVPVDVSPIECSSCNQYVYKNSEGCARYQFDYTENTNVDDSNIKDKFCDPQHPERNSNCIEPHGTCTPSLSPSQKCPFT